jgi:hypothetical protein
LRRTDAMLDLQIVGEGFVQRQWPL